MLHIFQELPAPLVAQQACMQFACLPVKAKAARRPSPLAQQCTYSVRWTLGIQPGVYMTAASAFAWRAPPLPSKTRGEAAPKTVQGRVAAANQGFGKEGTEGRKKQTTSRCMHQILSQGLGPCKHLRLDIVNDLSRAIKSQQMLGNAKKTVHVESKEKKQEMW